MIRDSQLLDSLSVSFGYISLWIFVFRKTTWSPFLSFTMANYIDPANEHVAHAYDALYERDQRHLAVDAYMNSHLILEATNAHYVKLEKILQDSLVAGLPDIACSRAQAKFLMLQARMSSSTNILEIGTLGGYSAAWLATASKDAHVTTLELDRDFARVAAENVEAAGLSQQIDIVIGPGLLSLTQLLDEVQKQERQPFDFVFIDANKQDNVAYFDLAMSLTKPHATIIVDNVVRNGKVALESEAAKDDRVLGTRQLIEAVGSNKAVDATVIQTVGEKNYDGSLLAMKV